MVVQEFLLLSNLKFIRIFDLLCCIARIEPAFLKPSVRASLWNRESYFWIVRAVLFM